jgi:hypothetical protein
MTHGINVHLDDGALEQYSMGDLSESEVGAFEEHLLVCGQCQVRLEKTDAYIASMRDAAAEFRSQQRLVPVETQRRWWTWLRLATAVAAAAVLIVLVGWWSSRSHMAAPPLAISFNTTRGAITTSVPADTWFLVRLDLAGISDFPTYRLQMVDATGAAVWQHMATAHDAKVEAKIPKAKSGTYFIRVYSPKGKLLREFGLTARPR